jgi:hypothetical protein
MTRIKKGLFLVLAVLVMSATLGGCASQMALLRGGGSKSCVLVSRDYDLAFTKVIDTAKETGYKVNRQDKEKGTFFLSRGWGYSEFTNLEIKIVKVENAELRMDLVASSSQGGEAVVNDFVTAYSKQVPIK